MTKIVGVRREDLDKRSEMRVAVTPTEASLITAAGHSLFVQPGHHPEAGDNKRAFSDANYKASGAVLQEDLSTASIVIGLKEMKPASIEQGKTYLLFSHTHKGQTKNREMLKTFVDQGATVIDYELIVDDAKARLLKAFTFFAGYGGMVDSLWTYGQRMKQEGIDHPFAAVPQSIEKGDLGWFKKLLSGEVAEAIRTKGTPANLPPLINVILGCGKTSQGAQEIYDLLPVETIKLSQLADTFQNGDRRKVYKLVLEVYDMYRLRPDTLSTAAYAAMSHGEKFTHYLEHPECYESNLDQILPYTSILMNCILWSPEYPRVLTNDLMQQMAAHQVLRVIGDITCDPNGAIEFSKETWVDDPVYTWQPQTRTEQEGFAADGVQVMAVTNLPCAFAADASAQFAAELAPLLPGLLSAELDAPFADANLPAPLQRATILWRGQFTPDYKYMQEYTEG